MDKITIAEFEIGTDVLIAQATKAKASLDALRVDQKKLAKETGGTSTEAYIKNAASIKNLNTEYNTYTKALQVSLDETGKITKVQKTLNTELNRTAKSIDGARASNKELLKVRNQLNLTTKEGVKQQQQINKKIDENNKFIKDNVSELEKQKIGIGDYAGGIENAIDKTGIFGTSLKGVTTEIKNIIGPLTASVTQLTGLSKAQQAAAATTSKSSKALRLFKIALISTGIGAIVVVIGSLIAAFASTQQGIDAITKALAPLKGGIQGIISVFQKLALNIGDISDKVFGQFKDNFTIAKNTVLSGVDQIRLAWNKLTGDTEEAAEIQLRVAERAKETAEAIDRSKDRAEGFVTALKSAGKEIAAAAETQKEIVELGIEIEKKENDLILIRAKQNLIVKEQNKIAEDVTKTLAEREAGAKAANEASIELQEQELQLSNLRISQKEKELSLNDTGRADQGELNKIIAERDVKATAQLEAQTTITNKLNIIRQSAAGEQQKRIQEAAKAQQEAIKRQEIELQLFELKSQTEADSLNEKKELIDEVLQKELEIIDAKQAANLSENEADIARIEARKNAKDQIAKIVEDEKQIERSRLDFKTQLIEQEKALELNKEDLLKSLRNERRLLEANTQQEQAEIQLEIANQQAQARIENELTNLQIEEEAKREQKLEFELENAETQLEKDELEQEAKVEKLERDLEFEEAKNIAFQEVEANYQIKKQQLEEKSDTAQKIANIENFKNRVSIAEKGAKDLLTISDALFGKSKTAAIASIVIGRAASIAQIISNTAIANAKAAAATPLTAGQPFVTINTISAGLSVAASVASGAKAISQISSQKAAKGISFQGTLRGNSHANGGIDLGNGIEAEGGENMYSDGQSTFIVNKQASSIINRKGILGALSHLNQSIGGGVPLSTPTTFAQSGGQVSIQSPSSQNASNQSVIDGISENINEIRVINVAEDTISVADESITVQNEANF